jgi:hypothetical protein
MLIVKQNASIDSIIKIILVKRHQKTSRPNFQINLISFDLEIG